MSIPASMCLASLSPQECGPEVEFSWRSDRFVHSIWFRNEGRRTLFAENVVESPELGIALVELHPQLDAEPHATLFLHGAGGGAQWSMSVEAVGEGQLRFDVAARVLSPPVARSLVYKLRKPEQRLKLVPGAATYVEPARSESDRLVLRPTGTATEPIPCTLRWQYAFTTSSG